MKRAQRHRDTLSAGKIEKPPFMKAPRILLCLLTLFSLQAVLLTCGTGERQEDLTGTWRLEKITEYTVSGQDTTVTHATEITDPDFHILQFRPDHSVIQRMNTSRDTGEWALRGRRIRIRFRYRMEPPQLVRTLYPDSGIITDKYVRSDTTLTVAVFRKEQEGTFSK